MKNLCDYQAGFSDIDLSPLLGISKLDYEHLIHSPLYHYKNEHGAIIEFFMYISPFNNENLLRKIKRNNYNVATFIPSEVFELSRQQLQISNLCNKEFTGLQFVES
jgi:hypothetical protein